MMEFGFEWTSVAYQETQAGNTTTIVLVMALIVAFLVLAAQYEMLDQSGSGGYWFAGSIVGSDDWLSDNGDSGNVFIRRLVLSC